MTFPHKLAGLVYGPDSHHLDHLAPLCSMLGVPLFVTEEEIAKACSAWYPDLKVIFCSYLELADRLLLQTDILFTCLPKVLAQEVMFLAEILQRKKLQYIWCPHGNSDKGHLSVLMEGLKDEDALLVYGKKMLDFLAQKNVAVKAYAVVGNYRRAYFALHASFYEKIVKADISSKLSSGGKTILFAPTWNDSEKSSSFFDASCQLIENLPPGYNLIVKPHPNQLRQEEHRIELMREKYANKQGVLFLTHFLPIYPLLNLVDIYVGDMSSIGYDFLAFDKPLFFLNPNQRCSKTDRGLYLFRCGTEVAPAQYGDIYTLIENHKDKGFSQIRKEVYAYTFDKDPPHLELALKHLCKSAVHL